MVVAELAVVVTELAIAEPVVVAELVVVITELAMVTELVMVTELGMAKLSVVIELAMVELVAWLIFSWGTSITSMMLSTKNLTEVIKWHFVLTLCLLLLFCLFLFLLLIIALFSFPFRSWRRLYEWWYPLSSNKSVLQHFHFTLSSFEIYL